MYCRYENDSVCAPRHSVAELRHALTHANDEAQKTHIRVIINAREGATRTQIVQRFSICPNIIRNWIRVYNEGGIDALNMSKGGRPEGNPKWVRDIPGLTVIFLPPHSPELNLAERYFEEMRRGTANRVFEKLEDFEKVIELEVKRWSDDTEAMKRLMGYGWIVKQCAEVN